MARLGFGSRVQATTNALVNMFVSAPSAAESVARTTAVINMCASGGATTGQVTVPLLAAGSQCQVCCVHSALCLCLHHYLAVSFLRVSLDSLRRVSFGLDRCLHQVATVAGVSIAYQFIGAPVFAPPTSAAARTLTSSVAGTQPDTCFGHVHNFSCCSSCCAVSPPRIIDLLLPCFAFPVSCLNKQLWWQRWPYCSACWFRKK